jgi:hypothetical protein
MVSHLCCHVPLAGILRTIVSLRQFTLTLTLTKQVRFEGTLMYIRELWVTGACGHEV